MAGKKVVELVVEEVVVNDAVTTGSKDKFNIPEMTASVSESLRDKAGIIFNSFVDIRLVTLDIANDLFSANQEVPVKGKTSVKLTKAIVKDRLESAGCDKIEISHIDSDENEVVSVVNAENFNSLANNVFTFTRLIAIASKCIAPGSGVEKVHTKAKKLMNKLCRVTTTIQVDNKDEDSYHFNLEYKPVKDFIRVCFSDKAKVEHGKENDQGNKQKSSFFGACAGMKFEDVSTLVGEITGIINSNDSDTYMVTFGLKSEVQKDSGTKKFNNLLDLLKSEDSIYEVIEKLKLQYPDADIELPVDELAIAAG